MDIKWQEYPQFPCVIARNQRQHQALEQDIAALASDVDEFHRARAQYLQALEDPRFAHIPYLQDLSASTKNFIKHLSEYVTPQIRDACQTMVDHDWMPEGSTDYIRRLVRSIGPMMDTLFSHYEYYRKHEPEFAEQMAPINDYYLRLKNRFKEILDTGNKWSDIAQWMLDDTTIKPVAVSLEQDYFQMPEALSLKINCYDQHGRQTKLMAAGSNFVSHVDGNFCKTIDESDEVKYAQSHDEALPIFMERAVGDSLRADVPPDYPHPIAPGVSILKMLSIPFNDGKDVVVSTEVQPHQPRQFKRPLVQVSQGLGLGENGMGEDEFFLVHRDFKRLVNILGADQFTQLFSRWREDKVAVIEPVCEQFKDLAPLFDGTILERFALSAEELTRPEAEQQHLAGERFNQLNDHCNEVIFQAFKAVLEQLPHKPAEFDEFLKEQPYRAKALLFSGLNKREPEAVLKIARHLIDGLALLQQSQIQQDFTLEQFLELPTVLKTCADFYRTTPALDVVEDFSHFVRDRIDRVSGQAIAGNALITEAGDWKFDNMRLIFQRDNDGNVMRAFECAIDNDENFVHEINRQEFYKRQLVDPEVAHFTHIKCSKFFNTEVVDTPLETPLRDHWASYDPLLYTTDFLIGRYQFNQRIQQRFEEGAQDSDDVKRLKHPGKLKRITIPKMLRKLRIRQEMCLADQVRCQQGDVSIEDRVTVRKIQQQTDPLNAMFYHNMWCYSEGDVLVAEASLYGGLPGRVGKMSLEDALVEPEDKTHLPAGLQFMDAKLLAEQLAPHSYEEYDYRKHRNNDNAWQSITLREIIERGLLTQADRERLEQLRLSLTLGGLVSLNLGSPADRKHYQTVDGWQHKKLTDVLAEKLLEDAKPLQLPQIERFLKYMTLEQAIKFERLLQPKKPALTAEVMAELQKELQNNISIEDSVCTQLLSKENLSQADPFVALEMLERIGQHLPFVDKLPISERKLNELFLMAHLYAKPGAITLLRKCHANDNLVTDNGQSLLQVLLSNIQYQPNNQADILATLRLVCTANPSMSAKDQQQNTPLFALVHNTSPEMAPMLSAIFEALVHAGANLNSQHPELGYSPLDYALTKQNVTLFKALVEAGAFALKHISAAIDFCQRHEALAPCLQTLMKLNSKVNLTVVQQLVSERTNQADAFVLESMHGLVSFAKVQKQLFTASGELNLNASINGADQAVIPLEIDGVTVAHIVVLPKRPFIQGMVHDLKSRLHLSIAGTNATALYSYQGQLLELRPVIPGTPLEVVLRDAEATEKLCRTLDPVHVCEMQLDEIMLSTNSHSVKDFTVVEVGEGELCTSYLVANHELGTLADPRMVAGNSEYPLSSFLFSLPQMAQPVPERLRAHRKQLELDPMFGAWCVEVDYCDERQRKLSLEATSHLTQGTMARVCERAEVATTMLSNASCNPLMVLSATDQDIADNITISFEKEGDIRARFKQQTAYQPPSPTKKSPRVSLESPTGSPSSSSKFNLLRKKTTNSGGTSLFGRRNGLSLSLSRGDDQQSLLLKVRGKAVTDEVRQYMRNRESLNRIAAEIYQGIVEGYQSLHTVTEQQKVLQKVKWHRLDKKAVATLVDCLTEHKNHLTELDLSGCEHISSRQLQYLVKKSPHLRVLKLNRVTAVNALVIAKIIKHCPFLEELDLSETGLTSINLCQESSKSRASSKSKRGSTSSNSGSDSDDDDEALTAFAKLRTLNLAGNPKMKSCTISVPTLMTLSLAGNHKLEKLDLNMKALKSDKLHRMPLENLDLTDCYLLPHTIILDLIHFSPWLNDFRHHGAGVASKEDGNINLREFVRYVCEQKRFNSASVRSMLQFYEVKGTKRCTLKLSGHSNVTTADIITITKIIQQSKGMHGSSSGRQSTERRNSFEEPISIECVILQGQTKATPLWLALLRRANQEVKEFRVYWQPVLEPESQKPLYKITNNDLVNVEDAGYLFGDITDISLDPNNTIIWIGGSGGKIHSLSAKRDGIQLEGYCQFSKEKYGRIMRHGIAAIGFTPMHDVISADIAGEFRLWDPLNTTIRQAWQIPGYQVPKLPYGLGQSAWHNSVHVSANNKLIVRFGNTLCGRNKESNLIVWDLNQTEIHAPLLQLPNMSINHLTLSPDGNIAVLSRANGVYSFDPETNQLSRLSSKPAMDSYFISDSHLISSLEQEGTLLHLNPDTASTIKEITPANHDACFNSTKNHSGTTTMYTHNFHNLVSMNHYSGVMHDRPFPEFSQRALDVYHLPSGDLLVKHVDIDFAEDTRNVWLEYWPVKTQSLIFNQSLRDLPTALITQHQGKVTITSNNRIQDDSPQAAAWQSLMGYCNKLFYGQGFKITSEPGAITISGIPQEQLHDTKLTLDILLQEKRSLPQLMNGRFRLNGRKPQQQHQRRQSLGQEFRDSAPDTQLIN